MHTYLILNTDTNKRLSEITRQTTSLGISPFDCISPSSEEPSIGIGEVRSFIKRLMLAPIEGSFSAGIIPQAELLTLEAQQALLKTLEEPPHHAYIFLGAANNLQLIPTIISRCIAVFPQTEEKEQAGEEDNAVRTLLNEILTATPGKIIHLAASAGKSKDDIDRFINSSVRILSTDLTADHTTRETKRKIRLFHRLLEAKKHLAHNVNPLLLVEQALL